MKIEGMGAPQQPDPKAKKLKANTKTDGTRDTSRPKADSVELNQKNKQLEKAIYSPELAKGGTSDLSTRKDVSELRDKTANGFYDNYETRARISDRLIESEELKGVVEEFHLSNLSKEILAKSSDIRHDKVADVKQKIAQGFYDNPQNYGGFADKIINHFGL